MPEVAAAITPPNTAIPMAAKKTVQKRKPKEAKPTLTGDKRIQAAALIIQAWDTGNVLWVKRGPDGDHAGEWAFPGGKIEPGEQPMQAALREAREETGFKGKAQVDHAASFDTKEANVTLYKVMVPNEAKPILDKENTDYKWAPLDKPPQPVHTGIPLKSIFSGSFVGDAWNENDHPRDADGKFSGYGTAPGLGGKAKKLGFTNATETSQGKIKLTHKDGHVLVVEPPGKAGAQSQIYSFYPADGGKPIQGTTGQSGKSFAEKVGAALAGSGSSPVSEEPKEEKPASAPSAGVSEQENGETEQEYADRIDKIKRYGSVKPNKKQTQALYLYISQHFEDINSQLRSGQPDSGATKQIKEYLSKCSIPEDTVVYRGISGKFANQIANANVGDWFREKAFLSTTLDRHLDNVTEAPVKLRISIPKGAHGSALSEDQSEVLFQAGSRLKITGKSDGFIDVEMLREDEPSEAAEKPLEMSKLTKIGGQLGSNPGGRYKDEEGKEYYIKKGKSPDHVRNEYLAGALYNLAGAGTLPYRPVSGNDYVATRWEKMDKSNAKEFSPEERRKAQEDFAVHAWTANWDAAGLDYDNQSVKDGKVISNDLGGALSYRAQGAPKGSKFGESVGEWQSLRDPSLNPQNAKLFGGMTSEQLKKSAEKVTKIPDASIREAVKKNGLGEEMANKLIARKKDIAKRAGLQAADAVKFVPPKQGPGGERAINIEFKNGGVRSKKLKESPKAWHLNTTTTDAKEIAMPSSPEHVARITKAVRAAAAKYGFPQNKVEIVNKDVPHDIPSMFDPEGTKSEYKFDPDTITFYPPGLEDDTPEYIEPIFRHELMHHKFQKFLENGGDKYVKKTIADTDYGDAGEDVSRYADQMWNRHLAGDIPLEAALHETLADMAKYNRKSSSGHINKLFRMVNENKDEDEIDSEDEQMELQKSGLGSFVGDSEEEKWKPGESLNSNKFANNFRRAYQEEKAKQRELEKEKKKQAKDSDYEEIEHNGRLPKLEARTFGSFIGPVFAPNMGSFKGNADRFTKGSFVGDEAIFAMDRSLIPVFRERRNGSLRLGKLALDESMRFYDVDGRLHVKQANISKAVVNPYIGNEIPDYEKLGLDPKGIYYLYRDPEELKKAAATFNGLPLLSEHQPVTATSHEPKLVVGSTGTDSTFDGEYLQNSLVIWPEADIKQVERNDKRQISCGYRYTADMTPGVSPQGEKYDGVMRQIVGNHVALVKEGRAGSDVAVPK